MPEWICTKRPTVPRNGALTVSNQEGLEHLLHVIDREDGLRRAMDFNVVYSLADRPCERCQNGKRQPPNPSIALVKVEHSGHPLGHLVTLCAEHADSWKPTPVT